MHKGLKRGIAFALCTCLSVSVLTGCTKKETETFDETAKAVTLGDASLTAGEANFLLRYEQAQFMQMFGSYLQSYYGDDLWNQDLTGSGVPYAETFKDQLKDTMEQMLLAEQHMGDYEIELTDDEKTAIAAAAEQFIADNGEDVLKEMSATQENVERALTLMTIQEKVQKAIGDTVDTEVSDEEAAQRKVSYVQFTAETEGEELEAVTEGESTTEDEAVTEAGIEAEPETLTGAEDATESALEDAAAEGETETEMMSEAETEDPAMVEAKAEARAKAEAFLAQAQASGDFAAEAEAATAGDDTSVYSSEFTFGDNSTYPDTAIIEATKGLEDGTLVDSVVEVGDSYYVLFVDSAFDREATDEEKENIVAERKSDAVQAKYDEWTEDDGFTVDEEVYGQLLFDFNLSPETEAAEYETEENSEYATEGESMTEAGTEVAVEE